MPDSRVHRDAVDGVPVFWVDKDEPSALHASLVFRVGKTDETLPLNGLTHLVEHVALHGVDVSGEEMHRNGHVGTTTTSFDIAGTPSEVVRFLAGVCDALTDLPTEHLENEQRVLEAESARTPPSVWTNLLFRRHGPAGPGLWWCEEFGRINADAESLRSWAAARFTSGAAALVLDGPIPDGLRLPLAPGPLHSPPELVDNLYAAPLWVAHTWTDIAAQTVLPRSADAVAWAAIAKSRLVSRLRTELGIAYSPDTSYDVYDADLATTTLVADAHPEHLEAAMGAFTEVLEDLAGHGPTRDELDTYRVSSTRQLELPPPAAMAFRAAHDHLHGTRPQGLDELRSNLDGLTQDSVRAAALLARSRLLYGIPEDLTLPEDVARPMPSWSLHPPIEGSWYRPATREPIVIAIGPLGTSWRGQGDDYVAVPYAGCRGVLAWPDGRRVLVSDEGLTLTVEPNLWIGGHGLVRLIDQQTADVRIPMPAREPEDIPRVPDPQPDTEKEIREARNGLLVSAGVFVVAAGSLASSTGSAWIAGAACTVAAVGVGLSLLRRYAATRVARRAAQADGAGGHAGSAYPS